MSLFKKKPKPSSDSGALMFVLFLLLLPVMLAGAGVEAARPKQRTERRSRWIPWK